MGLYGVCTFSECHMAFGRGAHDSATVLTVDGVKEIKISVGS